MRYTIALQGESRTDVPLNGRLVGELLETLDQGAKRALRLHVEGRSDLMGTYPKALSRAASFVVSGVSESPSALILRAPRLTGALAGDDLLDSVPPNTSAVGLFSDALRDALAGRKDSDNVDQGLVSTFGELAKTFTKGVETLQIRNGRPDAVPVEVRAEQVENLRHFQFDRPMPRSVRIAGKLNIIRHSDKAFSLLLANGTAVRGTLAPEASGDLRPLFGEMAVVSGTLHFRSSGRVLRLDATDVAPASPADVALWSDEPRPLFGAGAGHDPRKSQGPRSGLNAIYGKWPIAVTDKEFLAAFGDEGKNE